MKDIPLSNILCRGKDISIIGFDGRMFYKKNAPLFCRVINHLKKKGGVLGSSGASALYEYFRASGGGINVIFDSKTLKIASPVPEAFIEIDSRYRDLQLTLNFDYSGFEARFADGVGRFYGGRKGTEMAVVNRNLDYEESVYNYFSGRFMGQVSASERGRGRFVISMFLTDYLAKYGPGIIEAGFAIRVKGDRNKIRRRSGGLSFSVTEGADWFDLKVRYAHEEGGESDITVNPSRILSGLIKVDRSYTIVSPEDIRRLALLISEGMSDTGSLRISRYNFDLIENIAPGLKEGQKGLVEPALALKKRLTGFKGIEEYPLPENFTGTLRHYQAAGYNWLHFLNRHSLNGCLSDDMGLGKTVQVLSFLQKLKEEGRLGPVLAVVPVTTMSNWEIEINKFVPGLKYLIYYGSARKKDVGSFRDYDIVIVSYHTLRNDIKIFSGIKYDYVVLDESQNIKNYKSLIFRAIKSLSSAHRLSITGTPIENNTLELWSQMEFLVPGLLGTASEFKTRFARPIEVNRDAAVAGALKKRIFPFLMRRKKEDVLKELPPKTEITLYSDMGDRQAALYNGYRDQYRAILDEKISALGVEKVSLDIFAALLKLRQIAILPRLADKKYRGVPSCKYEQFTDLLAEIIGEGHKVLVYSQFLETLAVIKEYSLRQGWSHSYIDGSITAAERKSEIKKFQEDPGVKLFLLSLKAGGIGINLTSAGYVILFDPWWNPAVETQAVDRAHRIGQKGKVIAYKMIVNGTVEEKILKLQEKKKKLISEIITEDGSFYKALTKEDILGLFE